MYQTVNFYQFVQAFRDAGREDQFSYEALEELFNYLDDIEGYGLDVIASRVFFKMDDFILFKKVLAIWKRLSMCKIILNAAPQY